MSPSPRRAVPRILRPLLLSSLALGGACAARGSLPGPLTHAWDAAGSHSNVFFGSSVAPAGDVNGDGYSDAIVGAPYDDNVAANQGRAYLFLGSPSGPGALPAWTGDGDAPGARYGSSVASAGDVNGDGYFDVIVGAPYYGGTLANQGRVSVYLGSAGGLQASAAWTADGDVEGGVFGVTVACAGDVNGDGYSDVAVGGYFFDGGISKEGRVKLYLGSASGLAADPAWEVASGELGTPGGSWVTGAGDVDGDGYSDLLLGAPYYGEPRMGRAYLYMGSASGLASTPAWIAEGDQADASFGFSVAGAGDVNGDGYADVVVGAYARDGALPGQGRVTLYLGSSAGLAQVPAWVLDGDQEGQEFGLSVATAGDVNGDGRADVIIGSDGFDAGPSLNVGSAYVYFGGSTAAPAPVVSLPGDQSGQLFGYSVATAGDINGDGYSDVMVGAPSWTPSDGSYGRASLWLGGPPPFSAGPPRNVESHFTSAGFGTSLASGGDVNGDGYSDVIVGADTYNGGHPSEGRAFLYLGSVSGMAAAPSWTADGDQATALFGGSVACAGDVNGDGYDDLVVGASLEDGGETNEGRAYVFQGSPGGPGAAPAWTAESDQAQAIFGTSVAGAGDVNGDGYADILVGAPLFDGAQPDAGKVFLYLGSATGLGTTAAWTTEGDQAGARLGRVVACAGDVNRDGYSDVLVGAYLRDEGLSDIGRAYLYLGSPNGLLSAPAWTADGDQAQAHFGIALATAGDVNGDGYSDVIVGEDGFSGGLGNLGRAFVYLGSAFGLSTAPAWRVTGTQPGANFGHAVASAGDLDRDGFSEVVVGADQHDHGQTNEGRVFVYFGSASGLDTVSVWSPESDQAEALFGRAVATAGDVDGDGFSDLFVGAPFYDGGQTDEGSAFLYPTNGGDGLARGVHQRLPDGSAPIALLGRSVSNEFRVAGLGRTAAGRGRVRLECEAKPVGITFDGSGIGRSDAVDSGAPAAGAGSGVQLAAPASGLLSGVPYRWRARFASNSPFFPRTPWFAPPGNSADEMDLRTGGFLTGVGSQAAAAALRMGTIRPNPSVAGAEIHFTLPRAARATLVIQDLQGRIVASLIDGPRGAGAQAVRWNGMDRSGRRAGAGVYWVRLLSGGERVAAKLVRL